MAPGSSLAALVEKCQGALRLDTLFRDKSPRSRFGRLRKVWTDRLGLEFSDEAELRSILRPLRIQHESRTLESIRSDLADILPLAGLHAIDDSRRADVYPLLIQRLHREGQRWFGPDNLIELCKHEGLWAGKPLLRIPIKKLGIRTFSRFAQDMENETDHMVCLSEFFTDRHIRDPGLWSAEVLPHVSRFLSEHLKSGERYQLHLASVGSVAFAAGYLAEPKLGASFELPQSGIHGRKVWIPDSASSNSVNWSEEVIELESNAQELAIAISVTHSTFEDASRFIESRLPLVGKIVHYGLRDLGQDALTDGSHAFAAAKQVMNLIYKQCAANSFHGPVHLIWSAPNAFVFMLGQLARPLGPVMLYEFDFERSASGRYQPSLSLNPSDRLL